MLPRAALFLFIFLAPVSSVWAQENTHAGVTRQITPAATATQPTAIKGVNVADAASFGFSLDDCIRYALKNQPALRQAFIDESVAHTNVGIAFSSWLPQVNGSANLQHYFNTPVTNIPGNNNPANAGTAYTSVPQINITQTIFTPDVLFAVKAAKLSRVNSTQNTESIKINLVSDVSKAFYDLLLSAEQVDVFKEDTGRLKKNQSDAYYRYMSGLVDKVDYKQAAISLNNSMSQLKGATEAIQAKYARLKQLMGFPAEQQFSINFDTAKMMQDVYIDTLAPIWFEKRIEYQQLITARRMQQETTLYYHSGFLPSVSAFYNDYYAFQNDKLSDLYDRAYPYSVFGLQLNIPIFTGLRRVENIHKSRLLEERINWGETALKLQIYDEYSQALATYKSNLYNMKEQGENVAMAREVYDIVKLQYREGIKAYLDVIVAESALETAEINYLNALFQLLQSKIDLQKAMGDIPTDI